MPSNSWQQLFLRQAAAGPTLTAAAAASMLIASSPAAGQNRDTIGANDLEYGSVIAVRAAGIISCVASTPGSATWDIRFGSTVVYSTGALALNPSGVTNAAWWLDLLLTLRSEGATTAATLVGGGMLVTSALTGGAVATGQSIALPNTVSSGFDSTVANVFDSYFTQTVATGSFTCNQYVAGTLD
jgi:hypothetical protein